MSDEPRPGSPGGARGFPGQRRAEPNVITVTARPFVSATSWWAPVPPSYALGAGFLTLAA